MHSKEFKCFDVFLSSPKNKFKFNWTCVTKQGNAIKIKGTCVYCAKNKQFFLLLKR